MRKRMKMKRHSCRLCKPHKMGGECRWNMKELDRLKRSESEILKMLRGY